MTPPPSTDEVIGPLHGELQRRERSGELPGWALSVRHAGDTVHLVGGALEPGGSPVTPDTPWRLSSVTKPFGGVLAQTLLADGTVALDDPVARWAPELAGVPVLATADAALDDVVPVQRPPTVHDLLRGTAGLGAQMDPTPRGAAMAELGVGPGPFPPDLDADEHLARLGRVPLATQPGERFRYHTEAEVLGTVLVRASGRPLPDLLRDRVLAPLGLEGVVWHTDARRLGPAWMPGDDGPVLLDPPDGAMSRAPRMHDLANGLLAPAADVLGLLTALADGGGAVLSAADAAAVTTDELTPAQRDDGAGFLDVGLSWGRQLAVVVGDRDGAGWAGRAPGAFGWDGGTGTSAWVDPSRDLTVVLCTAAGLAPWLVEEVWPLMVGHLGP